MPAAALQLFESCIILSFVNLNTNMRNDKKFTKRRFAGTLC